MSKRDMWKNVLNKLEHLKELDKQHLVFGAERHHYVLRPRLSIPEIEKTERRLGVPLPETLRVFYYEVGDGVAGPYYGLTPAAGLEGCKLNEPYRGDQTLRQVEQESEEDEALAGLLPIIEEGCGHQVCLVTAGPKTGTIVYVRVDGKVSETSNTMIALYENWLDREIAQFKALITLMISGAAFEEIQKKIDNAGDRIASIADVKRPVALFGEGNLKKYHGATQFPWYEQILKEWQKRK